MDTFGSDALRPGRNSGVALAAVAFSVLALPAFAQSEADFFRGKTVTISVGFGPGGGYDRHARTLGRHIGKHIPGNPAIVVKNVPGAAGLVLANTLFNTAPKDGTEFGTFNRTVPLDPLLDNPQARFDARQFTWLGSTSNEINTCVAWHTAPAKSIAELRQHELMVAGTGPNADAVIYPSC
jgi:tripartite-type tricarboxylate transporter receptor subunit TctC